jgi:hypothetical protein
MKMDMSEVKHDKCLSTSGNISISNWGRNNESPSQSSSIRWDSDRNPSTGTSEDMYFKVSFVDIWPNPTAFEMLEQWFLMLDVH